MQGRTNVCDLLRIMGSDITPTTSPTSGHLTIILNLLSELLQAVSVILTFECIETMRPNWLPVLYSNYDFKWFNFQNLDRESSILTLKWCGVLLNHAQMYLSSLLITKEFLQTMKALIDFGYRSTDYTAIEIVLDDLLIFLMNPNNWDTKVSETVSWCELLIYIYT